MRRSDAKQKGKPWKYVRFGNGRLNGECDYWLIRSKTKGTVFFIPVEKVDDWTYPYLYRFVRREFKDLDLPPLGWTQLFINRIYHGLYLRMKLPFDKRKKDGGSGIRRELLTIDGDTLTKVDTRFDEATLLYVSTVVDGYFPELSPRPPPLAWLAVICPTAATTLLLSNKPPHNVSLLPLPVTMRSLYKTMYGQPAPTFVDERYNRWTSGSWRDVNPAAPPLTAEQRAAFRAAFAGYAGSFRDALRTHAAYHQDLDKMKQYLPRRQKTGSALGLDLGEL